MLNLTKLEIKGRLPEKVPQEPGVYVFWQGSAPIYIGKAINLKNRLSSYFSARLLPKTAKMIARADSLSYIKVISELEALLLEASLVKKYQPVYNSALKDDKHALYIKITKEKYPRVLTARKKDKEEAITFFGPFSEGSSVRMVVSSLRRIFPFSDHKLGKKPCIYAQIGLCSPCPNEIENKENLDTKLALRKKYLANINLVRKVLSGKLTFVKRDLEKEMMKAAKNEEFEEASEFKSALARFEYITQPVSDVGEFLKNPNFAEDVKQEELGLLRKILNKHISIKSLRRIECYDVAHLGGAFSTASMVTFIKGSKDSSLYRHFRIRSLKGSNDTASMEEVARRRAGKFKSWGTPDLIVVDGGRGQVKAFQKIFREYEIPVIGFAKMRENIVIMEAGSGKYLNVYPKGGSLNILRRIRDEAHRFARAYHHTLVSKSLRS